jgi:hypothetical protein
MVSAPINRIFVYKRRSLNANRGNAIDRLIAEGVYIIDAPRTELLGRIKRCSCNKADRRYQVR